MHRLRGLRTDMSEKSDPYGKRIEKEEKKEMRGWNPEDGYSSSFCAISTEGGHMDGQACLSRHVDIRRATDSEQRCCELAAISTETDENLENVVKWLHKNLENVIK